MKPRTAVDVVIVGGGPAGLSAALVLGRSRRNVVLFDAGAPRNRWAREMHGYLGYDGCDPAAFRREARAQLERYDTVALRDEAVHDARPCKEGGFEVELESGERLPCRKLLLATGLRDRLPELEGFEEIYGATAHNCPYCDGWEWRDRRVAVYGEAGRGPGMALEMLGWSRDVVLFANGPTELSAEARDELARNRVGVREEPIVRLERDGDQLRGVRLADGGVVERDVLFFATPNEQSCALASGLGCRLDDKGLVATAGDEGTDVPGLYVAGDASRNAGLAIVAAAEGARAAFAINSELLAEDRA